MLGLATLAGHVRFFKDASRLSFPPDTAEAAVCARYGMELLPPPSAE